MAQTEIELMKKTVVVYDELIGASERYLDLLNRQDLLLDREVRIKSVLLEKSNHSQILAYK